ncbi:uncharacterized protein LOC116165167 isoform X2 [Photinus pyralis]|uniref:uncharacterized protein LOC116165167 isoform X2 n=1 Tax=Photinus pyralis TaxID=7054 RepID=UPI00126769DA|nr:uncharacterized protein LOC116165167 isoform X2 [Photinus pyralis]
MNMSRECIICDKSLDDGTQTSIVKEKGLEGFIEASKGREDGKIDLFNRYKTAKEVEVHEKCRKRYTNQKLINAARKRNTQSSNSSALRSNIPQFSFKTHCFICGEEVPPDYSNKEIKKPAYRRNPVYPVTQFTVGKNIERLLKDRNDEVGRAILLRIGSVHDLPAADAQYHFLCMKELYLPKRQTKTQGRPRNDVDEEMQCIFNYIEDSSEECQFTIEELINKIESDCRPHPRTVKQRLLEKYGDDICITANMPYIVCFKSTGHKIINDFWYQNRLSEKEERTRIVETAAAIIVEDARSQVYNLTQYPSSDTFIDNLNDLIPESLLAFTDAVVMSKKKGNFEKWKKQSLAIADCLLTAIRPKSYISPLQVGVATFLYKKYGSRRLIDVLSSLGFCSSYTEAVRFEMSSMLEPHLTLRKQALSQFVYDNADFNIGTIDGHNTFHSMGGIICVTPKSAVVSSPHIDRLKDLPSAETIGCLGTLPVKVFEKTGPGLAAIQINPLTLNFSHKSLVSPSASHLLWLYGKHMNRLGIGGWNGFMEDLTRNKPHDITYINCQPFINSPPSDYNTIYTALLSSVEKSKSLNQQSTIVTFDQPLYLKAREVIASRQGDPELQHVILRLGGFHLLMSFMGAVGFIMEGSGLSELFNLIYAAVSTEKLLTGHAYARAVRAHMLAHRTLASIILETIDFSASFQSEIEQILYCSDRSEILSAHDKDCVKELVSKFKDKLEQFTNLGPTAKLWSQYFQMVTLILTFIDAERTGNWTLHLETIHDMLPYFHSSGHFLYAKCCHLYLQDMMELQNTMPPNEFKAFTLQGGFTIRRSNKFRCGTWSDMCIEQELMKHMKSSGGLTRGRGTSDAILSRWTLGMATYRKICDAVERFSGIDFASSEQHIDTRESSQTRDNIDAKKMMEWFHQHPPFQKTAELISLSTGVMGDEKINCHLSREEGVKCIDKMLAIAGNNFESVKFKRRDRVLSLATMKSSIIVHDQSVVVNPTTLFQRMSIAKESDEELEEFLTYELSPFPLALFDEKKGGLMRKGTKSTLYKAFRGEPDTSILDKHPKYVVDGGFLLHKVVWPEKKTFGQICDSYIEYLKKKYTSTAVVVFDGYSDAQRGTKQMERMRRSMTQSVDIQFNDKMVPTVPQEKFLSNPYNKSRFISMLLQKLSASQIDTKQASEDADTLIVQTAQSLAEEHETVVVVGEDVDLLVIMIGTLTSSNVYFLKPGKGKHLPSVYHPSSTIDKCLAEHILFIHAVSGCDSTSALFKQGKVKFIKTLTKYPDLSVYIRQFRSPRATSEEISEAGEKFLVALYGGDHRTTSINKLRYKQYVSSAFKVSGNVASIPPTKAAAQQHCYRVFHQVQQWLGNIQLPEQWGWKLIKGNLIPITTLEPPAPEKLLKLIACKCQKGCKGNCGCIRVGLYCSRLCLHCEGRCSNIEIMLSDDDEDVSPEKLEVERPAPILQELEQSTDQKGLKRKHYVAPEIQPGPSKRIICERNAELYAGDNSADEDADDE